MVEATPFLPGLSPVASKPLTAQQDAGNLTSNAGLIVLREAALRLDIARVCGIRRNADSDSDPLRTPFR